MVLVFNHFFDVLHGQRSKPRSHIFASSRTANNTKRANFTWLPLEIVHCGHTWHDYPWPWVTLRWVLYNLQVLTSRVLISKIYCRLSANHKRVSWIYNNTDNYTIERSGRRSVRVGEKALNNLSSADLMTFLQRKKVKPVSKKLYQGEEANEVGKGFHCIALFLGLLGLIFSFETLYPSILFSKMSVLLFYRDRMSNT